VKTKERPPRAKNCLPPLAIFSKDAGLPQPILGPAALGYPASAAAMASRVGAGNPCPAGLGTADSLAPALGGFKQKPPHQKLARKGPPLAIREGVFSGSISSYHQLVEGKRVNGGDAAGFPNLPDPKGFCLGPTEPQLANQSDRPLTRSKIAGPGVWIRSRAEGNISEASGPPGPLPTGWRAIAGGTSPCTVRVGHLEIAGSPLGSAWGRTTTSFRRPSPHHHHRGGRAKIGAADQAGIEDVLRRGVVRAKAARPLRNGAQGSTLSRASAFGQQGCEFRAWAHFVVSDQPLFWRCP